MTQTRSQALWRPLGRIVATLTLLGGTHGCVLPPALGSGDASPASDGGVADGSCPVLWPVCKGASAPAWQAQDFQPKSPRFGQSYGLEAFRGKPLVVALLSGW